jgi:hypothetical protein
VLRDTIETRFPPHFGLFVDNHSLTVVARKKQWGGLGKKEIYFHCVFEDA